MVFNEFLAINVSDRKWEDDQIFNLPPGVKTKILLHDKETKTIDMLLLFERDYDEPAHTHKASHSGVVLKGKVTILGTPQKTQLIHDETAMWSGFILKEGGFLFGPSDIEHGPYHMEAGTIMYMRWIGDTTHRNRN